LFEILEKIHFEKGYVKLCLNPGKPAHDVARAPPRRLAVPGPRAHAKAPEDPTV
jgi:hypothetical protein